MSPYVPTVRTASGARAVQIDSAPLPITSSRMGHLRDALARGYRVLGLEQAPSKSKPAPTPSSPPTPYPTTSATPSSESNTTQVRTN